MIVNCDVVGLEVLCAAFLSQDTILLEELRNKVDIHSSNQLFLGLQDREDGRLVAKKFKFRIIYGGTEFAFAKDPEFTHVSSSAKYWAGVIEKYYNKYKGIRKWHNEIIATVARDKILVMPTGREYSFEYVKNHRGELTLPLTTIKNYPVQGLGADIVAVARVSFRNRFIKAGIRGKLILTVHDSIVVDVHNDDVEKTVRLFEETFRDLRKNVKKIFGFDLGLEVRTEVLVGPNLKDLSEYK